MYTVTIRSWLTSHGRSSHLMLIYWSLEMFEATASLPVLQVYPFFAGILSSFFLMWTHWNVDTLFIKIPNVLFTCVLKTWDMAWQSGHFSLVLNEGSHRAHPDGILHTHSDPMKICCELCWYLCTCLSWRLWCTALPYMVLLLLRVINIVWVCTFCRKCSVSGLK